MKFINLMSINLNLTDILFTIFYNNYINIINIIINTTYFYIPK
jgi:hypothetical protein